MAGFRPTDISAEPCPLESPVTAPEPGRAPTGLAGSSYSKQLFTNEMQPDHLRGLALVEVATHGIPNLVVKLGGIRFREDRRPQGACAVAAFGGFFDDEDDLAHGVATKA
jgi:hypothetical protein